MKKLWSGMPGWAKWAAVIFMLCLVAGLLNALFVKDASADATVDLNWQTPTTNCDLTQLDDLAGYVIKWWFTDTPSVVVEQPVGLVNTAAITLIGDVEGKTVMFAITSIDNNGNRSDDPNGCGHSNEVTVPFVVTFPSPPTAVGATVR